MYKVKHAAVKFNDIIYVGKRHHNCFAIMVECGLTNYHSTMIQGFVDEKGNFLDRIEALERAKECGQITNERKFPPHDRLVSEDLY